MQQVATCSNEAPFRTVACCFYTNVTSFCVSQETPLRWLHDPASIQRMPRNILAFRRTCNRRKPGGFRRWMSCQTDFCELARIHAEDSPNRRDHFDLLACDRRSLDRDDTTADYKRQSLKRFKQAFACLPAPMGAGARMQALKPALHFAGARAPPVLIFAFDDRLRRRALDLRFFATVVSLFNGHHRRYDFLGRNAKYPTAASVTAPKPIPA